MASQLKVDTITGVTTAGSISVTGEGNSTTTNLQQGLAKAWVTFNGSASGAPVRDSFNVASTDDDGTGLYGVNFTSAMSSANYSSVCNRGTLTGGETTGGANANRMTAGSIDKVQTYNDDGSLADRDNITVHVLGDLA
mgnify:CR=1 FL=1|tara:strand:- start:40 stop:453 length:414 start_codon:yes stop_codon:yes gene_type:complete